MTINGNISLPVVPLTPGESNALALVVEGQWQEALRIVGGNMAILTTLGGLPGAWGASPQATSPYLSADEMRRLFGPDTMEEARLLLEDFKILYSIVQLVKAGTYVLVPWRQGPEGPIEIAIVQRSALPQGATLAVWPIVAAAAVGIVIAASAVIVTSFLTEEQRVIAGNQKLRLQMQDRMAQNAVAIRRDDPVFAAKLLEAMSKATVVEIAATRDPGDWIGRFFSGAGAIGQAAPVVALLALLFFASRGYRRRRAA